MRLSLLVLSLTGLTFFSCKKNFCDVLPTSIDGTWKMILIKDNVTNATITKPSSINKDVIITFVTNTPTTGTFTGKTPTNVFGPNGYLLGLNRTLAIPVLAMTKVAETTWGKQFVDNIRDAKQYEFATRGKLIVTTTNKTLTFKKL